MYRWVSSRLLAAILTLAVTLAVTVGVLIIRDHQQTAAADDARAQAAAQVREAWEADLARAKEEQAERERIAEENARLREEAQAELAKKRAAEERAERERAAREKAERERVAAERAAALAEKKRLEEEKKRKHVLRGTVLVPDVRGALVIRAGGRRGQTVGSLTEKQRERYDSLLESVQGGATYGCSTGTGGRWTDVTAGAQLAVEDGDGKLLAKSVLRGGRLDADGCTFTFALEVGYADYYRVRVTQRGPGSWSRDEMLAQGWSVALTL